MRYEFLSHRLTEVFPVYGGTGTLALRREKSIEKGDRANTSRFSMETHWGTHVDVPHHFFEKGAEVTDYQAGAWVFEHPRVVALSLDPSQVLRLGPWVDAVGKASDILLFRSGWGRFREQSIYSMENPGIHPEVGDYLRKYLPSLRAIGLDWISLSPYADRELGREAHRAFLDPDGEKAPILIVEDMNLTGDLTGIRTVIILPLRIEKGDAAPCTVLGMFDD
jgi:arylformamidase